CPGSWMGSTRTVASRCPKRTTARFWQSPVRSCLPGRRHAPLSRQTIGGRQVLRWMFFG
ncbi:MAG: hypothetical protein AVDCRST_MAG55-2975, partial [uncultured Rubrobacteraceae bacterium]